MADASPASARCLILAGIVCQIMQLVVSIRHRAELRDLTGDPWDGRSLEWATASPPPVFNFAVMPDVTGEDAYWAMKRRAREERREGAGLQADRDAAQFADRLRLRVLRHRHGIRADLAHLVDGDRSACIGAFATFVVFAWRDHDEYEIPADEVARIDRANLAARRELVTEAGSVCDDGDNDDLDASQPASSRVLDEAEHEGPAPKRIVTGYGFWIFLLSDIVMFSCFFAAYAVLLGQTAGGPSGRGAVRPARTSRSRPVACCCRASPAAWPASPPRYATSSGSRSRWP